jgi:hypothetical protein
MSKAKATAHGYSEDELYGAEDVSAESEEDLAGLDTISLSSAVLWGTDWTVGTIVDQLKRRTIALDPAFQRRDAWTDERKSRFIESLILGLPIPQLILAESKAARGKFIVIDGKQRLLSLAKFTGTGLAPDQEPLTLTGLQLRKSLNGCTYKQLRNDRTREELFSAFENQPIRTVVIRGWKKEDILYTIFHRLNTGSLPLSPQELRQALHPGPFLSYAATFSEKSEGLRQVLGLIRPDFRMRDVELVVRFYAFRLNLSSYGGNLKKFLDDLCDQLNKGWENEDQKDELQEMSSDFEESIKAALKIFSRSSVFRKWDGERFEKRLNRAIFDVVAHSLADPKLRRAALGRKGQVLAAFKSLCKDADFRKSIESTTKSKQAVRIRFSKWYKTVSRVTGKTFHIALPPA